MKKELIVAIVLLSLVGTFAETDVSSITNDTISLITAQEVKVLDLPEGVMLRLLQLERQIELKIEQGNVVIERINEYNSSIDTTGLQEILDNMSALKEDLDDHINNISNSEINITEEKEYYLWFKNESLSLVEEFRTEVSSLIDDSEFYDQLRLAINEVNESSLGEINNRIRIVAKEYNAERVKWLARRMGVDNETIGTMYNFGNMTKEEALGRLRNMTATMDKEQLNNAIMSIRKEMAEEKVNIEAIRSRINVTKIKKVLSNYKVRGSIEDIPGASSVVERGANNIPGGNSVHEIVEEIVQEHGAGDMK